MGQPGAGRRREGGGDGRQVAGEPEVVVVEEADVAPDGGGDPGVAGADSPPVLLLISRTRASASTTRSTTSAVESVEPSSTTISSRSGRVWARTDPITASIRAAELKAGMTTLKVGVVARSAPDPGSTRAYPRLVVVRRPPLRSSAKAASSPRTRPGEAAGDRVAERLRRGRRGRRQGLVDDVGVGGLQRGEGVEVAEVSAQPVGELAVVAGTSSELSCRSMARRARSTSARFWSRRSAL